MGSCAGAPSRTQQTYLENDSYECAAYACQGKRPSMEDTHSLNLSFPNHPSYSLFGAFDGFNGCDASAFLAANLVTSLDKVHDLEDNTAIIKAIEELDMTYIHSEEHKTSSGCTYVFALIHRSPSKLHHDSSGSNDTIGSPAAYGTADTTVNEPLQVNSSSPIPEHSYRCRIFWAGDSRAVLMSSNSNGQFKFERLTQDHNCKMPEEAKRIAHAEGKVVNNRIDGIIETTRCFGCHRMKNNTSLPSNEQKLICVPDMTNCIGKRDDRLLIFTDGLIKKWKDHQFNTRCKHHLTQQADEKQGELYAMQYLCEQAMDEGSPDNITVMSIHLK
eukprot:171220_1